MNKKVSSKIIYLVLVSIILLSIWGVSPTFANFSNDYTTDNDIVGLQLNFDLKLSNIEEYEEIKIESNSYEIFNINILNSTENMIYYGVWYKMVQPNEINNNIIIARLEDNLVSMNGTLDSLEDKTVSVIIKNNSTNDIIVNVGVDSSEEGIKNIEYLGGKHLIVGSAKEVDYYYEEASKKYVSSIDNNTYFMTNSIYYDNIEEMQTFISNHLGSYKLEVWGASNGLNNHGAYISGILKLKESNKLYFYIGQKKEKEEKEQIDSTTDIRLTPGTRDDAISLNSRILIAGTNKESSYVSGYQGYISQKALEDDDLKEKCTTGQEDIECSYHRSGMILKHIKIIDGTEEMDTFDGKSKMIGNNSNGYIKITPVVPTINVGELKIKMGEQLNISNEICQDNGNGCYLVRILPEDTKDLSIGHHTVSFMVSDDDGIVYRYLKNLEVQE